MKRKSQLSQIRSIRASLFVLTPLATLFALSSLAEGPNGAKNGFMPGSRPFNPFLETAADKGKPDLSGGPRGKPGFAPGIAEDDEDFEDLEDYPLNLPGGAAPQFTPPTGSPLGGGTARNLPGTAAPTFSAGGAPNTTVEPKMTPKGIQVGGNSPSGVVSQNTLEPLKINDETGEGSRAIITDFNFPDADIMDIAKTLGKLTGKNFIVDKEVKGGRITIISNSPITVGDAWKAFLTALDINNFALVPSGKYIRIARQRDARDKQLKTYTQNTPDTDALITQVFSLKYISAEEVARSFRSFMPANSRIIPYEQTNTVIVTDTGSNIVKLAKMLEILDVEGFDAGIEVIPVKYASAAELSKLIDTLIPGTTAITTGGAPGAPRFGGGRFSARRTKEGGIINTIIADERTNTLIVHANSRGADQVRELVAKLDQKLPAATGSGKVHVVYLQFADAEQISQTLNNLLSQSGGARPAPSGPGGGGTGVNPVSQSLFEGNIRIAPDKATNSLVITASGSDFLTIQRVVNRLDIPRDQVYVEVIIMEVQIARNFDYSANLLSAPSKVGMITNPTDIFSLLRNDFANSRGAILGFPMGGTTSLTIGGQTVPDVPNLLGLIKFLQTHTQANVLATPQIIALDNSEANFESAEKIPVPTLNQVMGAALQTTFTKEPVALSINIKPQINKITNFVRMEVQAKMGDISQRELPKVVSDNALATLERTAKTTVVVADSDTVVLGGLIRDKISDSTAKVPILGDIPLLGWLFKSKRSEVLKSNLLIFMTPHIVRQYEKVRAILDEKLKERDQFLEGATGGEDPLRHKRDSIIRSLPEVKSLSQRPRQTAVTLNEEKPAATYIDPRSETRSEIQPENPAPITAVPAPATAPAVPFEAPPPMEVPAPATPTLEGEPGN